MNVILDIDETFVQFATRCDWLELPEAVRAKYETTLTNTPNFSPGTTKNNGYILRPGFREFFTELSGFAKTINLWTLSDAGYALDVQRLIERTTPAKITNVWCDQHNNAAVEEGGKVKDLRFIWSEGYKTVKNTDEDTVDYDSEEKIVFKYPDGVTYSEKDTILIDDLERNTQNDANRLNGIHIKAFDPVGEKLDKTARKKWPGKVRTGPHGDQSGDTILSQIITFLKTNPKLPMDAPKTIGLTGGRRKTRKARTKKHRKTLRR